MSDSRIPLTCLPDAADLPGWLAAGGPAAVLADGPVTVDGVVAAECFDPRPRHRFGCACCAGRLAAAVALDRLFQARARGTAPWFDRVAVIATTAAGRDQAEAALREDVLTLARFRPA
jgi:hypothetical protein